MLIRCYRLMVRQLNDRLTFFATAWNVAVVVLVLAAVAVVVANRLRFRRSASLTSYPAQMTAAMRFRQCSETTKRLATALAAAVGQMATRTELAGVNNLIDLAVDESFVAPLLEGGVVESLRGARQKPAYL